jgi:hypothetical protein
MPGPSPDDPWVVRYFRRHPDDDPEQSIPGQEFLRSCPPRVRAHFFDVLIAVAKAPPPRFAGGGKWEAMHGDMTGYYEVRATGPGRHQYRLFCLLEAEPPGPDRRPVLVILTGLDKPSRTTLSPADYRAVRAFGEEYRSHTPRSWA